MDLQNTLSFSWSAPSRRVVVLAAAAAALLLGGRFAAAQDTEEIIVTHAQGETVLPAIPETVLTFDLASLSTLDVLGIPVAGVPEIGLPESLSQYADTLKVGSLFEPDYEAVNAAEPDLVIVAARSAAVYPQLSEIAPTIDLTGDNTRFLAAQQHNAEILGQIFGKEEEVAALWADLEAQMESVRAQTAEAGNALIVSVSGGEITAYGPGSRFGWIHDDLGLMPVIEDIEEATHGEAISFEFILEANPDWLIVLDRDAAIGEQAEAAAQVLDNELMHETTAWANDQVIYIEPANWYLVMGGLGALPEMVADIGDALPPVEVTAEATAEATEAAS